MLYIELPYTEIKTNLNLDFDRNGSNQQTSNYSFEIWIKKIDV